MLMKRLAGALVGVLAIVGMRYYSKASAHDDVKSRLIELCAGDAGCQTAVTTHYEACFDASYKMGAARASSKLDASALVKCINTRAGEDYFTVKDQKQ